MRTILTFILAVATTPALAVADYAQWKDLRTTSKVIYAAGTVDALSMVMLDDSDYRKQNQEIMEKCFANKSITYDIVAEQIDSFYAENVDKWEYPPAVAFLNRFMNEGGICDRERSEILDQ